MYKLKKYLEALASKGVSEGDFENIKKMSPAELKKNLNKLADLSFKQLTLIFGDKSGKPGEYDQYGSDGSMPDGTAWDRLVANKEWRKDMLLDLIYELAHSKDTIAGQIVDISGSRKVFLMQI
jgi:hypothetical protein